MRKPIHNSIWWGPPKKFSTHFEERKISWLELFYDLVYVIVISKVTHYLATHPDGMGIVDYVYLFTMTFWGWYNGSQYHDLHGSPGIRTRFMTLWQMIAVGVLAVTLDSPQSVMIERATISIMILQLFITYLWWSVGIYDKNHRTLNRPYTVCFLLAFGLLILTFYVPSPYKRIVFWLSIALNFSPFFLTAFRLRKTVNEFSISSSMTERLGLFTTIVFGEAILGVINGFDHVQEMDAMFWICFSLGILIVFALWWIFFALIADRECRPGILPGFTMASIYVPALASLGMIGASFPSLFGAVHHETVHLGRLQLIYGSSIAVFLCCIVMISRFLLYPETYEKSKRSFQLLLVLVGVVNLLLIALFPWLSLLPYLICVFCSLLFVVVLITRSWYLIETRKMEATA